MEGVYIEGLCHPYIILLIKLKEKEKDKINYGWQESLHLTIVVKHPTSKHAIKGDESWKRNGVRVFN
jgi:hypothetical protein